jgi:hypothetical protein
MTLLKRWGRPERPAAGFRTHLSVLALEDRANPSSLWSALDDWQNESAWVAAVAVASASGGSTYSLLDDLIGKITLPIDLPPIIVDFQVVRVDAGRYELTGRVFDESPGGLVVTFGGVPSAEGQTATTNADGTFSLTLSMQTDGTDMGIVTAVTQDAAGQSSNVAVAWVDPT